MRALHGPSAQSPAMRALSQLTSLVAQSTSVVLILGETGSGKDFIVRHIHGMSSRSSEPFFSINCAALPSELAESELFGHEEGAFTGAHGRKRGLVELADCGTLLLNEIGELSLQLQAKLLTFLDSQQFVRVGGHTVVKVNVRIIAATNRDLERMISDGTFREDLFHRLNVLTVHVPPLRERLEDLPGLAHELLVHLVKSTGVAISPELDHTTLQVMASYAWPGNVRELRNVLERCLILSGGVTVRMNALIVGRIRDLRKSMPTPLTTVGNVDIPPIIEELLRQASGKRVRNPTRLQKERLYRECALEKSWKQKDIAQALGVSAATVSNWISDVRAYHEGFSVDEISPEPSQRAADAGERGRANCPDPPTLRVG